MAIKYIPGGLMIGLAADTKPVLPADGMIFIEEDTAKVFKITAGVWSESVNPAFSLKANLDSPTFTGTVTGITSTMVGLGNVNNTSDAAKPVSTAQQTALDLKAPLANPAFTGTPTGITKTHVGLGSVDNTADTAKPISTAQQTSLDAKQATLVSATNIKTVNGTTLLGSGDLVVQGGSGSGISLGLAVATISGLNLN